MQEEVTINVEIVKGGFIVTRPVLVKDIDGDGIADVIYERVVVPTPKKAVDLVKAALEDFKFSG